MIDRVDLLIAVIGIVVSILGSSTAMWVALSKKPDRADVNFDLARLETKLGADLARLETKLGADLARVETKLDALILRFVPEARP